MNITRRLLIHGDVQGVGFRYSLRTVAIQNGLSGWVRNTRDGSVEAVLHGDKNSVESVTDWCRHGPSLSRVDSVEVSETDGRYSDFSIRDTV